MKINKHHIAAFALCIYILAICILCFMNPSDMPDPELDIPGLDKLVHFMMFVPFPVLAFLTIESQNKSVKKLKVQAINMQKRVMCITFIEMFNGGIEKGNYVTS